MVLTAKQQEDINFAILEYLQKQKYQKSADAFQEESAMNMESYKATSTTPVSLLKDVLERKFTSIARLKKQMLELEKQCKQQQETIENNALDMIEIQKNGGLTMEMITAKDNRDNADGYEQKVAKSSGDAIPREPEKMKLRGHRAKVTKVVFHPVYTQIASSSEDASIKIWDYETGECEQTLREHTGMVNYLNFHPKDDCMASCSKDMTIKLWKRKHGDEFKVYKTLQGHDHEVSAVEYLRPNGEYLISCSRDKTIRFWDTTSGFLMQTFTSHNEWVRRIAQNQNGTLFASASKDETVIIWDVKRIRVNMNKSIGIQEEDYIVTVIDDHQHVIDCIKFAPDTSCQTIQKATYNSKLVDGVNVNQTVDENGNILDVTTNQTMGDINFEESKRLDDDSQMGMEQKMTTREKVQKLKEDLKKRKAMLRGELDTTVDQSEGGGDPDDPLNQSINIDTTAQEEKEIEAGSLKSYIATGARDKKIRIFEVKTGKLIITLAGHDNWVTDLWFHPNGKYLISSADDKSIRIWDLVLGRCYRKIYNAHDHFVSCFDMKGKIAASGSVDTTVKLWQAR